MYIETTIAVMRRLMLKNNILVELKLNLKKWSSTEHEEKMFFSNKIIKNHFV